MTSHVVSIFVYLGLGTSSARVRIHRCCAELLHQTPPCSPAGSGSGAGEQGRRNNRRSSRAADSLRCSQDTWRPISSAARRSAQRVPPPSPSHNLLVHSLLSIPSEIPSPHHPSLARPFHHRHNHVFFLLCFPTPSTNQHNLENHPRHPTEPVLGSVD